MHHHLIQDMCVKFVLTFHAVYNFLDSFRNFCNQLLLLAYHLLLFLNAVDHRLQLGNLAVAFCSCGGKFLFCHIPGHIEVNELCTPILDGFYLRFQLFHVRAGSVHGDDGLDNGEQIIRDFLPVQL